MPFPSRIIFLLIKNLSKKNISTVVFLCAIIFFSCAINNTITPPVPPKEYFIQEKKITIDIDNITETKHGASVENLPDWLSAFIKGGVEEVEKMSAYHGKYVFIGINEGTNFTALEMWADNFSTVRNFTLLAAERIQRRMVSSALLYPDDEYGEFFETMIKNAYSVVYPDVSKESTYWIKLKTNNEIDSGESVLSYIYNYFILIIIDKTVMQTVISDMMENAYSSLNPLDSHRNAIDRLRKTFFEGY